MVNLLISQSVETFTIILYREDSIRILRMPSTIYQKEIWRKIFGS